MMANRKPKNLEITNIDLVILEEENAKIATQLKTLSGFIQKTKKEVVANTSVVLLLESIDLLLAEYTRTDKIFNGIMSRNTFNIDLFHELISLSKERKDMAIEITNHITKLQRVIELFDLHKKDHIYEPDKIG
jgi:hypothetical protein